MKKEFISELFKKFEEAKTHFAEFSKMVDIGIGVQKSIEDIALTKYANNCSTEILVVKDEKVNYLKNIKQGIIKSDNEK